MTYVLTDSDFYDMIGNIDVRSTIIQETVEDRVGEVFTEKLINDLIEELKSYIGKGEEDTRTLKALIKNIRDFQPNQNNE